MYSGRLAYHASCSATSGESSASSAKPMRILCHRSGSGSGTSSTSSKAEGSAGATDDGEGGAAAEAAPAATRSARASAARIRFKSIRLVLVSFELLHPTPSRRQEKGVRPLFPRSGTLGADDDGVLAVPEGGLAVGGGRAAQ